MTSWRQRSVAVLTMGMAIGLSGLPAAASADNDVAGSLPAPVIVQPELPSKSDFGQAVSVDGDTLLVGAPGEAVPEKRRGSVRAYVPSGSSWVQQDRLRASDGELGDDFGSAVSVDGDTALIGAPHDDDGGETDAGSAYVFVRSGSTWTEQAKLVPSVTGSYTEGGLAVALDGDVAAVAAPNPAGEIGAVAIFTRSGTTWAEQALLEDPEGDAGPVRQFGYDIALDGDTLVVGTAARGLQAREAFVYVGSDARWTLQAVLPAPAEARDFSTAVDIDGDRIVIGAADTANDGQEYAGSAYVFERSGSTWRQTARLKASDPHPGDGLGVDVSVSGRHVVSGAYGYPHTDDQGAAYVFRQRSGGTWRQTARVQAPVPTDGERFGFSVDLDEPASGGPTMVIGTHGLLGTEGAVYIYRR